MYSTFFNQNKKNWLNLQDFLAKQNTALPLFPRTGGFQTWEVLPTCSEGGQYSIRGERWVSLLSLPLSFFLTHPIALLSVGHTHAKRKTGLFLRYSKNLILCWVVRCARIFEVLAPKYTWHCSCFLSEIELCSPFLPSLHVSSSMEEISVVMWHNVKHRKWHNVTCPPC